VDALQVLEDLGVKVEQVDGFMARYLGIQDTRLRYIATSLILK
jgi:hypothetical protein